jgi:hypothetical protein
MVQPLSEVLWERQDRAEWSSGLGMLSNVQALNFRVDPRKPGPAPGMHKAEVAVLWVKELGRDCLVSKAGG